MSRERHVQEMIQEPRDNNSDIISCTEHILYTRYKVEQSIHHLLSHGKLRLIYTNKAIAAKEAV